MLFLHHRYRYAARLHNVHARVNSTYIAERTYLHIYLEMQLRLTTQKLETINRFFVAVSQYTFTSDLYTYISIYSVYRGKQRCSKRGGVRVRHPLSPNPLVNFRIVPRAHGSLLRPWDKAKNKIQENFSESPTLFRCRLSDLAPAWQSWHSKRESFPRKSLYFH